MSRADLGARFRAWRAHHDLTLYETALLLGVGTGALSGYERGREPWPDEIARRVEAVVELKKGSA